MNELTDAEFCSWLDKLQAGETVPERLPPDDAADLAFVGWLFERQFTPRAAPLTLAQLMSPSIQEHLPVVSTAGPPSGRKWRVVLSLASLAAVLTALTLVYPPARAMAEQVIQKIIVGKITVVIEDTTAAAPTPEQPPADNYSTIWTPASLAQVQAKYPNFAQVPGWTPAGYVFQERVAVHFGQGSDTVPAQVVYAWRNSPGHELQLMVISSSCSHAGLDPTADCFKMFVYTDATHQPRSIQVNGQTAAIMTGGPWWPDYSGPARVWNPTHYRSNPGGENGLSLTWEKGPNEYLLAASSGDISEKDLIRTAESIP